MSIASYCRRAVCTADPEETLLVAAQRMEKEGIGLLVVTQDERLAGVLTDRDVALAVAAEGLRASSARVDEAMSRAPVSVAADASLEQALGLMRSRRVRRLPLVDAEERVAGLVSADDLVRLLSHEIGGLGEVLTAQLPAGASRAVGREAPEETPRRAVARYVRDVVTASSSASIAELAREMREGAVGCVVVLDAEQRAVGLVTDRDIALRVVAAGLDPATTAASAVISTPLIGARPSDPLEEVVERMRTAGVRRIPILSDGRLVGIVTFDDLLVAFGGELEQLAGALAAEIRAARAQSLGARYRQEIEERIEEAGARLRQLGDQTLRTLGGEFEQVVDRVVDSIRARVGERRELRVGELMQADVRSCTPQDALGEAARIMWERDCGCVPVVSSDGSGRVVGMLTDRDVCMAAYTEGRRLDEIRVEEAMATRVHSCRVADSVSDALRVMQSAQVRRLPVVDGDGLLRGILSLADVAEAALRAPAGAPSHADLVRTLGTICRPRSEATPPGA
jgi:CBS domain-containing protein